MDNSWNVLCSMLRIIPVPKYSKDNCNAPGRTFIRVVGVHSGSTARGSRRLHSRSDASKNDDNSFSRSDASMNDIILFQMLIEGVGESRNLIDTESKTRFDARDQMSAAWSTNNPTFLTCNLILPNRWKILWKTMTHDFKCDDYCLT